MIKAKYNNWLNEDKKKQTNKLGLLLEPKQTNRSLSLT